MWDYLGVLWDKIKKCESFVKILCSNCEKAGDTPKNRGFVGQNGERCAHLLNTGVYPKTTRFCVGVNLYFLRVYTPHPEKQAAGLTRKRGFAMMFLQSM